MLAGAAFKVSEVGVLVAPKARPAGAGLAACVQSHTELEPSRVVNGEIAGGEGGEAGCRGGNDAPGAAQHQGRRGDLAAGGPALMMAVAAEQMFEVIVGARQVGHGVAMEQTGPIAGGDLEGMIAGCGQSAGPVAPLALCGDQAVIKRSSRACTVAAGRPAALARM